MRAMMTKTSLVGVFFIAGAVLSGCDDNKVVCNPLTTNCAVDLGVDLQNADLGDGGCSDMGCLNGAITARTSGTTKNLTAVTYNNTGKFVAVGDTGILLTSSDGINWTLGTDTGQSFTSITNDGSTYVAVTADATNGIFSSTDLTQAWDHSSSGIGKRVYSTAKGSVWVGIGAQGEAVTSLDGHDWSEASNGQVGGNPDLYSIYHLGTSSDPNIDMFLAVGALGAVAIGSYDITHGTLSWGTSTQSAQPLDGIAYNGSNYVVVSQDHTTQTYTDILTSPNGTAWTKQSSGTQLGLAGVAWTGHVLIAVGKTGGVFLSNNGQTWQNRTTGSANFRSVNADGPRVVIVGEGGAIYTYEK